MGLPRLALASVVWVGVCALVVMGVLGALTGSIPSPTEVPGTPALVAGFAITFACSMAASRLSAA